ncbi:hypothetical protein, partial [Shewanella sp.]|uniref:hypothetical protein n=1 Tax=Shewanella sp. TaxID=50422 RepID=UPI003568756A
RAAASKARRELRGGSSANILFPTAGKSEQDSGFCVSLSHAVSTITPLRLFGKRSLMFGNHSIFYQKNNKSSWNLN